ncbi:MAG: glycosyltransferase family 1 protein [Treponema sp.]|nr:glycosyltransferase family 1 protein [Treponema sp.]
MRIAYFTDTYMPEINGVTNTLSRLGAYLDSKNVHHMVFAPVYNVGDAGNVSQHRRIVRYKGITTALSTESRLAFPAFWDVDNICDMFKPDIIHVTTELGIGFRGMRYALSRNVPLVMSYHTDYCKYLKYHNLEIFRPLLEKYLEWFYSFSDRTLAPSRHTMEELFRKGFCNLHLWSRGIDTRCFNPAYRNMELRDTLGKDKFIFLYVGRLSREKNLDMLLQAAEEIQRRFPGQTSFVFTGDGPYYKTIQNFSPSNVLCTGFKQGRDLSEIYASADCFAFPSGTETFGNVVLEAMASGLPVSGVASGGVMDFLSHDRNALLCPVDDVQTFTNNLVSVMQDKSRRLRLAKNARKDSLSMDWNCVFDGLINTYNAVLEENYRQRYEQSA